MDILHSVQSRMIEEGFVAVPLWDADFLRHRASGLILDFRYLRTITVYEDFAALCSELESYDELIPPPHMI